MNAVLLDLFIGGFVANTKEYMQVYMRERHQRLKNDPAYKAAKAEQLRRDRLRRPEFFRAREFAREMKKYSASVEWYRDKLIEQGGLCAVCHHLNHSRRGELHRLQVDHDHRCCDLKTKSCGNCLRGLLCETCNVNLSYLEKTLADALVFPFLGSSQSWTAKALRYLNKFSIKS
jgi:hypothetical protein